MASTIAHLVWKDGRRQKTGVYGGSHIIMPHNAPSGRVMQTTFDLKSCTDQDGWLYEEARTEDVSARVREAEARHKWEEAQRRGWLARFSFEDQAFLPGETAEEQLRRINIEKYGVPVEPAATSEKK